MGSARRGSNPLGVVCLYQHRCPSACCIRIWHGAVETLRPQAAFLAGKMEGPEGALCACLCPDGRVTRGAKGNPRRNAIGRCRRESNREKRPALPHQPNLYLEPKWLRCFRGRACGQEGFLAASALLAGSLGRAIGAPCARTRISCTLPDLSVSSLRWLGSALWPWPCRVTHLRTKWN